MASSSSAPLERGKACLRCRRRKMRCDGTKPICGQCSRAEETECEYTDGGPTPSQLLERNVADLEARIRELEGRTTDTITLHDPHSTYRVWGTPTQAPQRYSDNPTEHRLLCIFLDRSPTLGFIFNKSRFVRRLTSRPSVSPVSPALLILMQLLALFFCDEPQLKAHEPQLLSRGLQALSSAMTNIEPTRMIEVLQAEILMAFYFFNKDRKLEGGYHITAAVSIAVACNLHKIRGSQQGGPATVGGGTRYHLPPPADDVEEGERIASFWAVYCLDRCWSVALKSQSVLSHGDMTSQIETPWPLDSIGYEQGLYPQALMHRNVPTIKHFLDSPISTGWDRSSLAIRAQASTLFETATGLASQWDPTAAHAFQAKFLALDNRIEHFKRSLPGFSQGVSLNQAQQGRPDINTLRCLLSCHTLAHCATVQLHTPIIQHGNEPTNSRTLSAAIAAANLLREVDVNTLGIVDPILGVLWSTICQVLIRGIVTVRRVRVRSAYSGRSATPVPNVAAHLPGEMMITSALDCVQMALEALSGTSPLLERELANLRQARSDLQTNN